MKLGEGAKLVETCQAMCRVMNELHIGIDGGKDSLSMAAKVKLTNGHEVVKSPGTLVISAYAPVPDIRLKVTPELKIDNCKFKAKVVPGDTMILRLELNSPIRRGICEMRGTVFVGNKIATEADLVAQLVKRG